MVFATVLVLGVAWFAVGALGKAARTAAEYEIATGRALLAAKKALLAYVAQYAARTDFNVPGRLPCPELLNVIGTANEGQAASSCSNSTVEFGRLPWKTLGVDQIRDGDGEPLWYLVSPGFRNSPLNFDNPPLLSLDGTAAVALIVAPGRALNTLSDPGAPPAGCSKVAQQSSRYATPLDPAKFFECGDAATGSFRAAGTSPWSNDRVIAITAAEWIDAIAGPVADRLQRQVAPALNDWRTTESVANWGISFMPYASTFSDPASNDLCGDNNVIEGMPPLVGAAASACTSWTGGSVTRLAGLLIFTGCNQVAGTYRCQFLNLTLLGALSARVTASAPNAAGSLRAPITAASIGNDGGGTVSNFSLTLSPSTGQAALQFDLSFPASAFGAIVTVSFPNLPDAAILSDPRLTWYLANNWHRHTYYALAPAASVNPTLACALPGDPGCLTVSGLAGSTPDDKQFVLALMGRAVAGQTRPSANPADYLEAGNATTGDQTFQVAAPSSTFNDRLAACPFQYVPATGGPLTLCN